VRGDENAVAFVREFHDSGKPMAVSCHGPWVLVDAGAVLGRRLTSGPTVSTDVRNVCGEWVNEEFVTDDGLVASRKLDDISAFNKEDVRGVRGREAWASAGRRRGLANA
jgi:protease I